MARCLLVTTLVAVAVAHLAVPVAGQVSLDLPTPIANGLYPNDMQLADLNDDGFADLVVAQPDDDASVIISLNDGTGTLLPGTSFDLDFWGDVVTVGDLDGDGDPDVLANVAFFVDNLHALLNDGAGGFTQGPASQAGSTPEDAALADLDGDGTLDVLLANRNVNSMSTAFGDGTGAFAGGQLIPVSGGNSLGVAAGDFNGDGDQDAALACFGSETLSGRLHLFDNPGDGDFGAHVTRFVGSGCWSVSAGDLDGDGDLDLLTTHRNTDRVVVHRNDGAGGFGSWTSTPVGHWPIDARLADLDGDGDLDVAVPAVNSPDVYVLTNDGGGGLSAAQVLPGLENQFTATVGDLDGDGDIDLLTGGAHPLLRFQNLNGMPSTWSALGGGVGGHLGQPLLTATGALVAGATLTIEAFGVPGPFPSTLVLGASQLGAPFRGGTLVPAPDVLLSVAPGAFGELAVGAVWPAGVPVGLPVVLQWWIADDSGPYGLTASQAVMSTTG